MKSCIIYRFTYVFIFLLFSIYSNSQNEENQAKAEHPGFKDLLPAIDAIPVLYLGSYHMSNPGADQFNLESDDVLLPKRQAEIEEVVALLKAFKPTKIAIESPLGDSLTLARYQSYLKGELELRRSEEEQIGFRLAKILGHNSVYPIDVKMGLDNAGISVLIGSDPAKFGPYMAGLEKAGNGAMQIMGNWLKNGTIRDMLYNMNDPEIEDIALKVYFHAFVPIVQDNNYAGADMVNTWYQRNIRIFSNLHQISDSKEDRILVVYGQGHVPLLKHFTRLSPYFKIVDVRAYLEK
jgi:hypothetical protein